MWLFLLLDAPASLSESSALANRDLVRCITLSTSVAFRNLRMEAELERPLVKPGNIQAKSLYRCIFDVEA